MDRWTVTTRCGPSLAVEAEGTGPGVILVHGLGFDRRHWRSQIEALASSGYRAVYYDLRGFGDSQAAENPFTVADLAADLEAVRTAAGLEQFHLVGHSLGGMCAQAYTLEYPEQVLSLTLASTTSHSGNRGSAYGAALGHLAMVGFDKAMEDASFRSKIEWAVEFLADPEVRKELNGTLSEELPQGERLLRMIRKMTLEANPSRAYAWQATVGFSTRHLLGDIQCPSLVLHGTRDMIIPYVAGQLLHEGIQGSRWLSAQGAGHSLPTERSHEFNDALLSFLSTTAA